MSATQSELSRILAPLYRYLGSVVGEELFKQYFKKDLLEKKIILELQRIREFVAEEKTYPEIKLPHPNFPDLESEFEESEDDSEISEQGYDDTHQKGTTLHDDSIEDECTCNLNCDCSSNCSSSSEDHSQDESDVCENNSSNASMADDAECSCCQSKQCMSKIQEEPSNINDESAESDEL